MTIEKLMQPRFKVIADYPVSEFTVGEIIEFVVDRLGNIFFPSYDEMGNPLQVKKEMFDKYPHLFRPLAWWEEREEKDMPEYVKYAATGKVCKVDRFDLETTSAWFMFLENGVHPYAPGGSAIDGTHWLPATESEFLNQNKKAY